MINYTEEILQWNCDRGNYTYDNKLEYAMLDEELDEYVEACTSGDLVAQADALADLIFVATGSLFKLCGNDRIKMSDIMLAVTSANNLKGKTKNSDGKVTKPTNFEGPEKEIAKVLFR